MSRDDDKPAADPWSLPPEASTSHPSAPAPAPARDEPFEAGGFEHVGTAPTPSLSSQNSGAAPAAGAEEFPAPFGRYTLLRRLGVGGMSEVFEAVQDGPAGFEKTVVIKRLLPHLAQDQSAVEMFLREARIAGNLHHPHVAQVYELGELGGRFFIAMELVDGLTLHSLARRFWGQKKSLPLELVAQAISDAAEGLHYAHTRTSAEGEPLELVHRDISPDNLIIDRHGNTKLLDFGIAKGSHTDPVTKTGDVKGKIPYMPPELLQDGEFDHRGDLWALGVSLYWLLAGRRPFIGETDLRVMQAILQQQPTPPSDINDTVPPEMDELVAGLLAKNRERRPHDGADVVRALKPFLPAERSALRPIVEHGRKLPAPAGKVDTTGIRAAVPTTDRRVRTGGGLASATSPADLKSTQPLRGPALDATQPVPEPAFTPPPVPAPPPTGAGTEPDDVMRELEASQRLPWAAITLAVLLLAAAVAGVLWLTRGADTPAAADPPPAEEQAR